MKAILLVRVSTERQSFDEQENELFNFAVSDGYKESDIVCIAEKESGIKLDEDERKGLNRMKEKIEKGDVACVYAWEISRISRRKKVLFSIVEYLTERKIQLKIKNPEISLLNSDGSINEAAETVFTLFAQLAEAEMRNKKVRFERGKKALKKENKYIGGHITYGYYVNQNKEFEIDPETSKVVRMIFEMYATGKYSSYTVAAELRERGIIRNNMQICQILSNISYTGETNSSGYTYKQIISKSLYDKCNEIMKKKQSLPKTQNRNVALSKGLFYNVNGHKLTVLKARGFMKHQSLYEGDDNIEINLNMCDSALWSIASDYRANTTVFDASEMNKKAESERKIIEEKIETANENINKSKEKIEKAVNDSYTSDLLTPERLRKITDTLNQRIEEEKRIISSNNEKLELINSTLRNANTKAKIESLDVMFSLQDDKLKKQICDEEVEKVVASHYSNGYTFKEEKGRKMVVNVDKKYIYKLEFFPKNPLNNPPRVILFDGRHHKFFDEKFNELSIEEKKKFVRMR